MLIDIVRAALVDLPPAAVVVVAVSGGPDSTALLCLLVDGGLPSATTEKLRGVERPVCEEGGRLVVAHLDHQLRPDSAADRAYVETLARRFGLSFHGDEVDVRRLAQQRGRGIEEAARNARYDFLDRTARAVAASAILLGHTLDDRAETVLLRLVSGAGSGGLSGMRARRGLYRRPLLPVRRATLHAWLHDRGEQPRTDSSNADLRAQRNYVRSQVIPVLEHLNPRVVESLARTADILESEDRLLGDLASSTEDPSSVAVLAALPNALARRVVVGLLGDAGISPRYARHEHIDAVLGLARGSSLGDLATDLPGRLRVRRQGDRIAVVPIVANQALDFERELVVPGVTWVLERPGLGVRATVLDDRAAAEVPRAAGNRVCVGLKALGPRPTIRAIRRGDTFRALAGPGRRRLGRYLRDRGIARDDRAGISVVAGPVGILWVVGHQVAESARVEVGEKVCILEVVASEAALIY